MFNSVRVLIPTYNRPELIQKATLAYLERSNFPIERVDIWISGESQLHLYDSLPAKWRKRFHVGAKGLMANRLAAERSYKEGTRIFWLNDDIFKISELAPGGKALQEVPLQKALMDGFTAAKIAGAWLWGIYAVQNHFYMAERVHTDLRYVVGCAYGVTLRHDDWLQPVHGDAKEDYERACRFYQRDKTIVRLDRYCPKTIYYNSAEIFPNTEHVEQNIRELERMWPTWVTRNTSKKSPYPEINIKDPLRAAAQRAARAKRTSA